MATGVVLTVTSVLAETQLTDLTNAGGFFPKTITDRFDYLTILIQQHSEKLARVALGSVSDVSPNFSIGTALQRANKYLSFDSSGNVALASALVAGTLTQSNIGTFLTPQTPAEVLAGVTPTNIWIAPGNVLRYGTNTTPGTTSMSAAFQAAVNQQVQGGAAVYAPTGLYLITTPVATASAAPFTMYGDGIGKTVITKTGDSDAFTVTNSGSAYNQINISDLTVTTVTAMATGNAFTLTCTGIIPSVTVRNVMVITGASTNFASAFRLINCGECEFSRVFIYGANSAASFGINATASTIATVYKFIGCSIYGIQVGASFANSTNPGIEGIQFYGCDIVSVQLGVSISNSQAPTYFPPQITWIGGHINASVNCFLLQGITQVVIQAGLFYFTGSTQFISLTNCGDLSIVGNTFVATGGTPEGITSGNSALINLGLIADNVFKLGASGNAVNLLNANFVQNAIITKNLRSSGTATVATTGTLTASTIIKDNFPLDSADVVNGSAMTVTATGMTLVGQRSSYINLATPGGSTTVTSLVSRGTGDRVTLISNSPNVTLQHNATADGFFLSGGANFTFTANYNRITLERHGNNFWEEVSRS